MNGCGALTLYPPAKINPFLEVLGKRPDGYHEIETLLVKVNLRDRLEIRRSDEYSLECRPDLGLPVEDNLVTRAVRRLEKVTAKSLPVGIRLWKNIPDAAGLGGGSSDAASTLIALNRLYELGLPRRALAEIAACIGSDVPSFLYPGAVVCHGRGEHIRDTFLFRGFDVWLILSGTKVSTPAVYDNLKTELTQNVKNVDWDIWRDELRKGVPSLNALFNRLEEAVGSVDGKIGQVRRRIGGICHTGFLLCGSGSAFFVIPAGKSVAMELQGRAADAGWEIRRCRAVNA